MRNSDWFDRLHLYVFIEWKLTQLLLESHVELFGISMQPCISFWSLPFDPLLHPVNILLRQERVTIHLKCTTFYTFELLHMLSLNACISLKTVAVLQQNKS